LGGPKECPPPGIGVNDRSILTVRAEGKQANEPGKRDERQLPSMTIADMTGLLCDTPAE
jgi:hypothetical protein